MKLGLYLRGCQDSEHLVHQLQSLALRSRELNSSKSCPVCVCKCFIFNPICSLLHERLVLVIIIIELSGLGVNSYSMKYNS
jgi:hypothetical protein